MRIDPVPGKKVEHTGVKIELLGQIGISIITCVFIIGMLYMEYYYYYYKNHRHHLHYHYDVNQGFVSITHASIFEDI